MHKKQDSANNLFTQHKNQIFTSEKIVKKVENRKKFPDISQKRLDKIPHSGI